MTRRRRSCRRRQKGSDRERSRSRYCRCRCPRRGRRRAAQDSRSRPEEPRTKQEALSHAATVQFVGSLRWPEDAPGMCPNGVSRVKLVLRTGGIRASCAGTVGDEVISLLTGLPGVDAGSTRALGFEQRTRGRLWNHGYWMPSASLRDSGRARRCFRLNVPSHVSPVFTGGTSAKFRAGPISPCAFGTVIFRCSTSAFRPTRQPPLANTQAEVLCVNACISTIGVTHRRRRYASRSEHSSASRSTPPAAAG